MGYCELLHGPIQTKNFYLSLVSWPLRPKGDTGKISNETLDFIMSNLPCRNNVFLCKQSFPKTRGGAQKNVVYNHKIMVINF